MRQITGSAVLLLVGLLTVGGCGDDDDDGDDGKNGSPDNTGKACAAPADCYKDVAPGTLKGEVECMDRVPDGYCTHLCTADTDCCAVEGECKTTLKQVCSPFESLSGKRCFLSCEGPDIVPAGTNPSEYCQKEVGTQFHCESSGGGSENRKVCVPADCADGEACKADADCAPNFLCDTRLKGGYCVAKKDCITNAECGPDARCTKVGNANYCLRTCAGAWDCSLCRPRDLAGTCRDDVDYVEAGTTGSVCVPPS
jgi:hypothetical protein